MPLNTKSNMKKDYLFFQIDGPFDLQSSFKVNDAILDAIEKHQALKILVDFRGVSGSIESMERFHYAEMMTEKYWAHFNAGKIKLCRFVFLGNYPQLDPGKFDETVAVNRGLSIRTTHDPKEAFEWLGVQQDPAD